MKRNHFNNLMTQALLNNTEFLHNNFELVGDKLYWRKSTASGKGCGKHAGKEAGMNSTTVKIRGVTIPVSEIIKAMQPDF